MRKKRFMGCVLIVLLSVAGLPCLLGYREFRQQQRNRDLIAAIYCNDAPAVIALLKEGADANARDRKAQSPSLRILFQQFLDRLRGKKIAPEQPEHSALLVAVSDYYYEKINVATHADKKIPENTLIVQALLEHGADVHAKDESGNTVLWNTTGFLHLTTTRLLLAHGADPNERPPDGMPILMSIRRRTPPLLMALLLENGADPNASYSNGVTALMMDEATVTDYSAEDDLSARLLLEHGANVNQQDNDGDTALMYAVHSQDRAGIRLLLEHGVNISLKNRQGKTALDVAKDDQYSDIVRLLEQAQAIH